MISHESFETILGYRSNRLIMKQKYFLEIDMRRKIQILVKAEKMKI